MKVFKFLLLLLLFSCEKQKEKNIKDSTIIDSLESYFKIIDDPNIKDSIKSKYAEKTINISDKLSIDSLYFNYHFKTARRFYNLNLDNQYKSLVLKILNKAIKNNDTLVKAKAYLYLGDFYLKSNKNDSAFYFYDKSEINYITKNDYSNINDVRLNKAIIQFYEKDFIGCETNIFRTLAYFKKNKKNISLNVCYTLLGLCQIETKDFIEADKNLKLALFYSQNLDVSTRAIETANNNLGILYLNKEDYKEAIKYFEKVLNNETKEDLAQIYIYAKQNLIYSKFKLGEIKNFKDDYDDILKEYRKLNLSTVLPITQLSEFYESQNDLKKAQEFAQQAYDISVKEKLFRDKLIALKQLTNVFPEKAKVYSKEYIKLNDSIAAVDKKIQNTFARIEYRVDELNNENLLLEQKNKITFYVALIIGLVIAVFLVYRWQNQKQREFRMVQQQQIANEEIYNMIINQQNEMDYVKEQEQKRISRELHDGVLGKLFGVRMNLDILNNDRNATAKDRQNYINEIIQVEKQIRQISHELSDETQSIINNYQLMIDNLVENQKNISGKIIYYNVDAKVPWDMFSAQEKINLYRIIQETFQNIIKYSKAKTIVFLIKFTQNKLEIDILDDGVGFDLNKASKGIGIKNMQDRAKSINAKYTISSVLNEGTQTQIELEINPNKEF